MIQTENARWNMRERKSKQNVALKTNKFPHCHAMHSLSLRTMAHNQLLCIMMNIELPCSKTEFQFFYCIFNLFIRRSHRKAHCEVETKICNTLIIWNNGGLQKSENKKKHAFFITWNNNVSQLDKNCVENPQNVWCRFSDWISVSVNRKKSLDNLLRCVYVTSSFVAFRETQVSFLYPFYANK